MTYKVGIYNDAGEPIGIETHMDDDERKWHDGDDYEDEPDEYEDEDEDEDEE